MRKLRGSVSVFLSCLLIFLILFVFGLLEVSRVKGLEQRTQTDAVMMSNSLMAEYDAKLWQNYKLLFLDAGYGSGQINITELEKSALYYSEENMDLQGGMSGKVKEGSWYLYGVHPQQVQITGYGIATDQNGRAFIEEAIQAVEADYGEDLLWQLYQSVSSRDEFQGKEVVVETTSKEIALNEDPIEAAAGMKRRGILSLVTGEENLSNKGISLEQTLHRRVLNKGNVMYNSLHTGWKDKILFRQYLERYFPNYTTSAGCHTLDYEMEYLIVGKSTDKENLQGVLNQLLAMRELSNLQFLRTNAEKQEVILAAATAMSAATLSPELLPVYKNGIMLAWAYAESVSDVRLLLDGQSVSLIKTARQWHTDISGLTNSSAGKEVEQKEGYSYQQYLKLFLWGINDSELAYRAMDLIEKNMNICMDCYVYQLDGCVTYRGMPLFSSLIAVGASASGSYQFRQVFSNSYITE